MWVFLSSCTFFACIKEFSRTKSIRSFSSSCKDSCTQREMAYTVPMNLSYPRSWVESTTPLQRRCGGWSARRDATPDIKAAVFEANSVSGARV